MVVTSAYGNVSDDLTRLYVHVHVHVHEYHCHTIFP